MEHRQGNPLVRLFVVLLWLGHRSGVLGMAESHMVFVIGMRAASQEQGELIFQALALSYVYSFDL